MAGITPEGLVIRRLDEVLVNLRAKAVELFSDLVVPGEVVDTSDSSTLGRLTALAAPSLTDLWEAVQEDYSAFDPNSAVGIPLDNIVAIGGITRFAATATNAQVLFAGDNGVLVTQNSIVSSPTTSEKFNVVAPVALSPSQASGATFTVTTVVNSTLYTITYATSTTTLNISFTSDATATAAEILAGLQAAIVASHPTLSSSVVGTTLVVDRVDVFQAVTFSTTPNLGITKCKKIGQVLAQKTGPIAQAANTITTIATPILGWDSITNPLSATTGRNKETDEELRVRFRNAKFERASNILEALHSALINLDGTEEVVIYENDTDVTDSNGVLPHSFMPIVLGGISTNIAETIWENKPLGIRSQGTTVVNITDSQGFPHPIGYKIPTAVTIYISMTLTTDANFPQDGQTKIKTALIDYFKANFGIGDDVIYSRLYTPINSIPGHQVNSLTIGTSPSPVGTSNIVINFDQIASLSSANIIITV
jgi:uncharacterized phage protein gp47/JayE